MQIHSFFSLWFVAPWIVLNLRYLGGLTCRAVSWFRNAIHLIEWFAILWSKFVRKHSMQKTKSLFFTRFSNCTDFILPFDHFGECTFRSHFTLFFFLWTFQFRTVVNVSVWFLLRYYFGRVCGTRFASHILAIDHIIAEIMPIKHCFRMFIGS